MNNHKNPPTLKEYTQQALPGREPTIEEITAFAKNVAQDSTMKPFIAPDCRIVVFFNSAKELDYVLVDKEWFILSTYRTGNMSQCLPQEILDLSYTFHIEALGSVRIILSPAFDQIVQQTKGVIQVLFHQQ